MKKHILIPILIILISSCIRGQIDVSMMEKKEPVDLINVSLANHQIILNGHNLNKVTSIELNEGSTVTPLAIDSQTPNSLIANTFSNVTFAAGKVFELIISDAAGATSYTINFSLCDSNLNTKGFDCNLTPTDKDVLSFDSATDKWIPRTLSPQWSVAGSNIHYSTGNVGIKTNAPGAALEVNGDILLSSGAARNISTPDSTTGSTSDIVIKTGSISGSVPNGTQGGNLLLYGSHNTGWGTGGSIRLEAGTSVGTAGAGIQIFAGGTVTAGQSAGIVHISGGMNTQYNGKGGDVTLGGGWGGGMGGGNINLTGGNSVNGNGNGGSIILNSGPKNGSGTDGHIILGNTRGNVGVGIATPTTKLQVAGIISPSTDGNLDLGTSTRKFKDIYSTGSIIQTSDLRSKREIKDSELGLDVINKLRPVSYVLKDSVDQKRHYGLIAQEAKNHLPNSIVIYDQHSERYGIKYTELIAPLIKSVQTLSKENQKLKNENELLKARLDKIEQLIHKLK